MRANLLKVLKEVKKTETSRYCLIEFYYFLIFYIKVKLILFSIQKKNIFINLF